MRCIRGLSSKRLVWEVKRHLRIMAGHGTTSVEGKSGYGLDEVAELKTLRVLETCSQEQPLDVIPTYLGAHATPPEFANSNEYIEWMCQYMMPQLRRRKLARFVDVYCEPGAFTVEQSRRYLTAARSLGFGLKVHADQFELDGGTQLGVEVGAVSVDHLEQAGAEEAAALSRSATIATLLPGSVFHLGLERYAPARLLIDSGCAVALATDFNMGTSPTFSMPMVLSLACTQMRMTPAEAISAATINGAHALGIAGRAGTLEFGKQADLLVLDAADYRELPYFFGSNPVAQVIKLGRVIVPHPEKS
jgi:imidazolonepropionase